MSGHGVFRCWGKGDETPESSPTPHQTQRSACLPRDRGWLRQRFGRGLGVGRTCCPRVTVAQIRLNLGNGPSILRELSGRCRAPKIMRCDIDSAAIDDPSISATRPSVSTLARLDVQWGVTPIALTHVGGSGSFATRALDETALDDLQRLRWRTCLGINHGPESPSVNPCDPSRSGLDLRPVARPLENINLRTSSEMSHRLRIGVRGLVGGHGGERKEVLGS